MDSPVDGSWWSTPGMGDLALVLYVAGVLWGVLVIDGPAATKIGVALLWPLGPIAFVVTVTMLMAASVIAFPQVGLVLVAAIGALVWWLLQP